MKDVGGEPMKTLRTYRTSLCPEVRVVVEKKILAGIPVLISLPAFGSGTPFFGVNLAVEKEGPISEGDTVFATAS